MNRPGSAEVSRSDGSAYHASEMKDQARDMKARRATLDDVVVAARDVLDEGGVEALTMANVARKVGFTTMAVYRHVNSRDELVERVVDLVFSDISHHEATEADWLDGVELWMRDVRSHLLAHPWVGQLLGTRDGPSPPWQATVRILLQYLARSGLSPLNQVRGLHWVSRITIGILIQEVGAPITRLRHAVQAKSSKDPMVRDINKLSDDDLFDDVVAQTRAYLSSMLTASADGTTTR